MTDRHSLQLLSKAGLLLTGLVFALGAGGCADVPCGGADSEVYDELVRHVTPLGARNWIVIAEASFPVLAGEGVETISVDASADIVFMEVLDILETEGRLQPRIWVGSELDNVTEDYAPGIVKYRRALGKLLPGRFHYRLANHIITRQVEEAVKTYRVLVIKTNTTLPYSNISIELDSGYWSADSEAELRQRIERVRLHDEKERQNAVPSLPAAAPPAAAPQPSPA